MNNGVGRGEWFVTVRSVNPWSTVWYHSPLPTVWDSVP